MHATKVAKTRRTHGAACLGARKVRSRCCSATGATSLDAYGICIA